MFQNKEKRKNVNENQRKPTDNNSNNIFGNVYNSKKNDQIASINPDLIDEGFKNIRNIWDFFKKDYFFKKFRKLNFA